MAISIALTRHLKGTGGVAIGLSTRSQVMRLTQDEIDKLTDDLTHVVISKIRELNRELTEPSVDFVNDSITHMLESL